MKHEVQKIEIKPRKEGEAISNVHLFINGTEIRNIRKLEFKTEPNSVPTLTVDLNAFDISIDSKCLMYQEGVGAINFIEPVQEEIYCGEKIHPDDTNDHLGEKIRFYLREIKNLLRKIAENTEQIHCITLENENKTSKKRNLIFVNPYKRQVERKE